MNKRKLYLKLEKSMLTYTDLASVRASENGEQLVCLIASTTLSVKQIGNDMKSYSGDNIYVRERVAAILQDASKQIARITNGGKLEIVYGYRAPQIQRKLFSTVLEDMKSIRDNKARIEAAHRLIASPDVAGHPTGGAVDVHIIYEGKPIEMGTQIWKFQKDAYTFSPFIKPLAVNNRNILRKAMLDAGFAPFDGEWWHYSYGDREWAKYYGKNTAIYKQIELNSKI